MVSAKWNNVFADVQRQEFWIFMGLLLWLGISYTLTAASPTWSIYGQTLLILTPALSPALLFAWHKERLYQSLSSKRYWTYWLLSFGLCLPVSTAIGVVLLPKPYSEWIVSGAIGSYCLELLLTANAYYQKRGRQSKWFKKLSLDTAILLSMTFIACSLGAMAVSSLGDPAYYSDGKLLIGFEFRIGQIVRHFGTFLSISVQFLLTYVCGYFFFYINSRFLVSSILKQHGLIVYVLMALALVAFLYPILGQFISMLPMKQLFGPILPTNPFKLENAFAALSIVLVSLPVVLALQWSRQNNQILALEKARTQTELDLLKQQLDPHFFFNTLNNLYALSLQQSKQTSESILQLSELMRYVIYKGKEPQVRIQEEVNYLNDYIQLQQIRLKKKLDVRFDLYVADNETTIAPLLLIVFVENAFKHGIEPAEEKAILRLTLRSDEQQLYFRCENSVEANTRSGATLGIGLSNLQRRLTLLYPNRHVLTTTVQDHIFIAELQLNLS